MISQQKKAAPGEASKSRKWRAYFKGHYELYLFLIPGLAAAVLFRFLPMTKIVIAFQQFKPLKGIAGSAWVGFAQFEKMFSTPEAWQVIRNTLEINLLQVLFCMARTLRTRKQSRTGTG